jgi:tetratricopeptide (TPR) repeat protein
LEHNPKYRQQAKEEIAMLTYKTGNYEGALEKAKEALSEYPKSLPSSTVLAMCYHQRAAAYSNKMDYDEAITEYEEALTSPLTDGLDAAVNLFLARIYEKRDKELAVSVYHNIVNNYPELYLTKHAKQRIEAIK